MYRSNPTTWSTCRSRIPPPGGSSSPTLRRAEGVFIEYIDTASSRCNLIERPTTSPSDSLATLASTRPVNYASSPAKSHPCSFSTCNISDRINYKQATSAEYSKPATLAFLVMMEGLISCSVGSKEEPHDTCSPSFGTDPLLIPRSFLEHSLHCVHDPYCGPLLSRSAHATVSSLQWGNSTLGRS